MWYILSFLKPNIQLFSVIFDDLFFSHYFALGSKISKEVRFVKKSKDVIVAIV